MDLLIISSSVRTGRKSHRVALFFEKFIREKQNLSVEILDLNDYQFPIFEERLRNIKEPSAEMLEFASKVQHLSLIHISSPRDS